GGVEARPEIRGGLAHGPVPQPHDGAGPRLVELRPRLEPHPRRDRLERRRPDRRVGEVGLADVPAQERAGHAVADAELAGEAGPRRALIRDLERRRTDRELDALDGVWVRA